MDCPRCKGTGEVPDRIDLECVKCQCKVVVSYTSTADLAAKCGQVVCKDCSNQGIAP